LLQPLYYKKSPFLQYGTVFSLVQNLADRFLQKFPQRRVWLVSDVGLNQPLGCSLFIFRDDRYKFVTGGKLGAVGGGLGIAMGVAFANRQDLVIFYCGDTGFQMTSPDWISLKESGLDNILIFVFENSGIGLIEEEDLEQKSGFLLDGNGYKNTADWKSLFSANLFHYYLWTDNNENFAELVQKISCQIFKNVFVTLCVVEYDVYYSPVVGLGDSFIDMQYFPGANNVQFQKKRIELIKNCTPSQKPSSPTWLPLL
jgi:thiamine pyrophosphate-dependent acetolactate synthase large subunit-like protein